MITINNEMGLRQLAAAAKDHNDIEVKSDVISCFQKQETQAEMKTFGFDREGHSCMTVAREMLKEGYRPATVRELLAFLRSCYSAPRETILALGEISSNGKIAVYFPRYSDPRYPREDVPASVRLSDSVPGSDGKGGYWPTWNRYLGVRIEE